MWTTSTQVTLRLRQPRSLAPWQNTLLPQVMSPSSLTTSTTRKRTEMIFQEESGDKDTEPSYLRDAELDDETIGKALSSPLFTQERGESADRRQAYHPHEESLLPAQSFFTHTRTGRPVHELSSCRQKTKLRNGKTKQSGFSLKDKKSKFSLILEPRFRNTSFKPNLIGEVFRNWMELSNLSEEKLIILLQVMNNFDEINYFSMNNYQNKIVIFVMRRVSMRLKNWSDFKALHSMDFRGENWSKIKTLSMNSRPEFRN